MSINSLSQSFIPYNINGLTEVNSDTSIVNTLQVNSLTPNKVIVSDSNNFLTSASASTTEVNYLLGTTSNIQTQINSKASTSYVDTNFLNKTTTDSQSVAGNIDWNATQSSFQKDYIYQGQRFIGGSTITTSWDTDVIDGPTSVENPLQFKHYQSNKKVIFRSDGKIYSEALNTSKALVSDSNGNIVSSGVDSSKIDYLDNVSSDIQTQLNTLSTNKANITYVDTQNNAQDLVINTKASTTYVDSQDNLRLLKTGDTMTGTLNMGSNKITTTYTPINNEDVITKGFADSTYATSSALANYLPLTGGTLTGNFTVNGGTSTSISDGLSITTNTRATTINFVGSTINGTHVSATIATLPSPPPVYNITYSGGFSGGLSCSFFPTQGLTYRFTFTKIWRQGLPGGVLTLQFLQNVSTITGLVGFPLTSTISITPTSYATATTITGTFTPPQAGALFLSFYSISGGATSFYWDSFTLTDITASVSAPLSLTKSITQPINSSAEFAGGLQVSQYDLGLSAAGFITTGLPTFVNGGTLSGPSGSFYRLTALSGQTDMAMRPSLLSPLVGERYTYVFRGIRSSVPLTLQVIQSTLVNVISTEPLTNNIGTDLQDITGSFISANNTTANAFRFLAGSANPWVEWATFSLFRSDTNVRGLLTVGGNTAMLGNATVAGTVEVQSNLFIKNSTGCLNVANGNDNTAFTLNQLVMGYRLGGNTQYAHAIKTRHNSGVNDNGNAMDFYVWQTTDPVGTVGTKHRMTIGSAGVGIGTTNPDYTLDVNGTGRVRNSFYVGTEGNTSSAIFMGGPAGDATYPECVIECRSLGSGERSEMVLFKGNDSSNGSGPDRIRLRAAEICFDTYSSATTDRTAESIRMIVKENGNVGIGQNPSYKLDVNGDVRSLASFVLNNIGDCRIFNGTADAYNPTSTANNLIIKSWWGIGFQSFDGGVRIGMDTRTGDGYFGRNLSVAGQTYCNDWFRNVGNGGLWNETYGRGIRCSDAEGNSYGNISTHGTGRNGWSGYGLGTRYAFMSNGSDIGSTWGIHDNTYSWLIRGSGFFNREVILGGGSTMCSRNFDRFVVWLSAAEYDYGGGYFFVNASGGFGITSDSRLKENIHPIKGSESITFLKHLQPSSFCMKEAKPFERENADGTKEIVQPDSCSCKQDGFIADNVYEAVVASGASKSVLSHWSGWLEEMKKPEEERELGKDNILGVCDRPILSHTVNVVKVLMEQVNILEQRNIILEQSARHQEKVFNEYKALTDSKIEKLANLLSQLIK
jgi:hypothetical protein